MDCTISVRIGRIVRAAAPNSSSLQSLRSRLHSKKVFYLTHRLPCARLLFYHWPYILACWSFLDTPLRDTPHITWRRISSVWGCNRSCHRWKRHVQPKLDCNCSHVDPTRCVLSGPLLIVQRIWATSEDLVQNLILQILAAEYDKRRRHEEAGGQLLSVDQHEFDHHAKREHGVVCCASLLSSNVLS